MKTKSVSAPSATGESDENPFASKGASKGGLSFGRVLSQSTRALGGKSSEKADNRAGLALGKGAAPFSDLQAVHAEDSQEDVGVSAAKPPAIRQPAVAAVTAKGQGDLRQSDAHDAWPSHPHANDRAPDKVLAKSPRGPVTPLTEGKVDKSNLVGVSGKFVPAHDVETGVAEKVVAKTDQHAAKAQETSQKSQETSYQKPHDKAQAVRPAANASPSGESPQIKATPSAGDKPSKASVAATPRASSKSHALDLGHDPAATDASVDGPVKDQTKAAAADVANPKGKEAAATAEAHASLDSIDALLASGRQRAVRGPARGAKDESIADLSVGGEAKVHGRESGRGRGAASEEGGKPGDGSAANAGFLALQSAGLLDVRTPLLHVAAAADDESHAAAGPNAVGAGAAEANGELASALRRELDRVGTPAAPTFTLPPPSVSTPLTGGIADVAPTVAPGAVLAPPELAAMPDDPALNLAVLTRAAHLSIEGQDGRSLELHVRLLPEGAEIRANGELAPMVQAQASELGKALAAEGMTLSRFELTQDHRQDGQRDPRATRNDDDLYRPTATRRTALRADMPDSATTNANGRIHVKA